MYFKKFSTDDGTSSIKMKFLNPGRQGILIIGTWNTDPIICFGCLSGDKLKYVKILNEHIGDPETANRSSSNVVELSWAAWSSVLVYSSTEITAG